MSRTSSGCLCSLPWKRPSSFAARSSAATLSLLPETPVMYSIQSRIPSPSISASQHAGQRKESVKAAPRPERYRSYSLRQEAASP